MIYTISASTYVKYGYTSDYRDVYTLQLQNLERGNTYITILCVSNGTPAAHQSSIAKLLDECKDIKILYKSPLAVNKNRGHGRLGRNCTYVFYYPTLCELSAAGVPDVKNEDKILEATT